MDNHQVSDQVDDPQSFNLLGEYQPLQPVATLANANSSSPNNSTPSSSSATGSTVSSLISLSQDQDLREINADRIAALDTYFDSDYSEGSNAFDETDGLLAYSSHADHSPTSPNNNSPTRRDTGTQTEAYDNSNGQLDLLSPANAQNFLPPSACLFAANLPVRWPNDRIKSALEDTFKTFGQVFVKVKRDPNELPGAFLQFASAVDCDAALHHDTAIFIGGRSVRLERAKCERTLYCSSKRLTHINNSDIERIKLTVERYGEVESIEHILTNVAEFYNLPRGVWIKFRLYGTCQEAYRGLLHHSTWRFELIRDRTPQNRYNPFPFSKKLDYPYEFPKGHSFLGPEDNLTCGSAVLVDGIPGTADENQILQLFSHYGSVHRISFAPRYIGHHSRGMRHRAATVGFLEPCAGPAAVAASARYGMAIQDACHLTWSSIHVSIAFSKPNYHRVTRLSPHEFDLDRYRTYVRNLQHPATVRRGKSSLSDSPELWLPWTSFEHTFVFNQLAASAPMHGAPATQAQIEAFNHTLDAHYDEGTGTWSPNGLRAKHYSLCQGLGWDESLEPTTPLTDDSNGALATCSGMSPLR